MFGFEKKKALPGDKDFLGGIFKTTVRKDGREYNVTTIKDAYGNIQFMQFTDKHSYR